MPWGLALIYFSNCHDCTFLLQWKVLVLIPDTNLVFIFNTLINFRIRSSYIAIADIDTNELEKK